MLVCKFLLVVIMNCLFCLELSMHTRAQFFLKLLIKDLFWQDIQLKGVLIIEKIAKQVND